MRGYTPVPVGWSWAVAGVVCFFTAYLAAVFLDRNPILPPTESTRQYLDLSYQLSLAGEAKHAFPPGLPQVAGEPLYYHWFALRAHGDDQHGRATSTCRWWRCGWPSRRCARSADRAHRRGRLAGQRPARTSGPSRPPCSSRSASSTSPTRCTLPFGTQATFVVWHGMSMIYSWVLVIALIAPLAALRPRDPVAADSAVRSTCGAGGALASESVGLLLLGNSGAKGSSLPVVALALALTAVVLLLTRRRIPWALVAAGLICAGRPAVRDRGAVPLPDLRRGDSARSAGSVAILGHGSVGDRCVAVVWLAFGLNMLLRLAGHRPAAVAHARPVDPAQWLLVAGGVAGLALYLVLSQPGGGNQYFLRTGFAFGVIASALGLRARRGPGPAARRRAWSRWARARPAYAGVLSGLQLGYAGSDARRRANRGAVADAELGGRGWQWPGWPPAAPGWSPADGVPRCRARRRWCCSPRCWSPGTRAW